MLRISIFFLLLAISLVSVCSAKQPMDITEVELGIGGVCKVGHWTPLRVSLEARADNDVRGRLHITLPDSDGVFTTLIDETQPPISIAAGQSAVAVRYVRLGRPRATLEVRFVGEDGAELGRRTFTPAELPAALPSRQMLVLTLGRPVGIRETLQTRLRGHAATITSVEVDSADSLPEDECGYGGVDTIVVPTSETSVLEKMTESQFAALDRWLKLGGRMVLCVGQRGDEVFAAGSRLAGYSPGRQAKVFSQRSLANLESYCGAKQTLDAAGGVRVRRFSLKTTAVAEPCGHVDTAEIGGPFDRIPTIVRFPYGFGQIVFVAVDLDQPPFTKWQSQPALIAKIVFDQLPDAQNEADSAEHGKSLTHIGYTDLVGQLRSSLDQFQGVTRVEFSWVAALLAGYILLIGPADYFLLKRSGRMHLTWLTFPLVALVFVVVGAVFANRWAGDRLHANQLEIVDLDLDTKLVRGFVWSHLYSPSHQTFDLSLAEQPPTPRASGGRGEMQFSWQGLPGMGLGGLDNQTGSAVLARPYELIRRAESSGMNAWSLRGLPIPVASSRGLSARWWCDAAVAEHAPLTVDRNGLLAGEITNPLSVELLDGLMMFDSWAYRLPSRFAPGEKFRFDGVSPLNLEWRLTRRRVIETKDVSTPWDPTSSDVPRIGEVMMFFQATGGENYTGLSHGYQPATDLSLPLRTGRALLVGRGEHRAAELHRGNQPLAAAYDQHWTWYRVAYVVDRPATGGESPRELSGSSDRLE